MDTQTLVKTHVEDAERWITQLKNEGFPLHAAFWAKRADEQRWSLYLATPASEESGTFETIKYVLHALQSLGEVSFRGSDVLTLANEKDPIVRDVLDFQRRFPDLTRKKLKGQRLGGRLADVFIYTLGEVPITVYGMIYRGEPTGTLHLSFKPHTASTKIIEVEPSGRINEYPAVTGIDWVVAAPERARLEPGEFGIEKLAWSLHGKPKLSNANRILLFADEGRHGFRILQKPADDGQTRKVSP